MGSSSSLSLNCTPETDFWGVGVLPGDVDGNRSKYQPRLTFSWSHTEILLCPKGPGGERWPRVNFGLGVCLTAAPQDQTKACLPRLNKNQKKTEKELDWNKSVTTDNHLFRVQEQSNVADFSRLANFFVLGRNMAVRKRFIYLVQEDIVWAKKPFSLEHCQHNMAQATSILKTPVH